MKKLITIILLLICSNVYSQLYITTDTVSICKWHIGDKTWDYDSYPEPFSSMFKINDTFTVIEHTTNYKKTTYYVTSIEDQLTEKGLITFDVISDSGNNYLLVVDKKNRFVKCIWDYNSKLYATFYTIIKIF